MVSQTNFDNVIFPERLSYSPHFVIRAFEEMFNTRGVYSMKMHEWYLANDDAYRRATLCISDRIAGDLIKKYMRVNRLRFQPIPYEDAVERMCESVEENVHVTGAIYAFLKHVGNGGDMNHLLRTIFDTLCLKKGKKVALVLMGVSDAGKICSFSNTGILFSRLRNVQHTNTHAILKQ